MHLRAPHITLNKSLVFDDDVLFIIVPFSPWGKHTNLPFLCSQTNENTFSGQSYRFVVCWMLRFESGRTTLKQTSLPDSLRWVKGRSGHRWKVMRSQPVLWEPFPWELQKPRGWMTFCFLISCFLFSISIGSTDQLDTLDLHVVLLRCVAPTLFCVDLQQHECVSSKKP